MALKIEKLAFRTSGLSAISNNILIVYLFLVIPTVHLWLGSQHWIAKIALDGYIFLVLTFLLLIKSISIGVLGFSIHSFKQNIILGFFAGGSVLFCLPALDLLVKITGLSETDLISNQPEIKTHYFSLAQIIWTIIHTVLDQLFFFGIIAQSWLMKRNRFLVVYLIGLIFAVAHAKLTVGVFAIGLIGCLLFSMTGTLIASGIFQIACLLSRYILETTYSHLATLLGFLF